MAARKEYAQLEKVEERGSRTPRLRLVSYAFGLASAVALGVAALASKTSQRSRGQEPVEAGIVELAESKQCSSKFTIPKKPKTATELNGVKLEDVCLDDKPPYHAFIIGDWGGLKTKGKLTAVSHLNHRWNQSYQFVYPIDANCQMAVRDKMEERAPVSKPAYILNVGDNFYWGGVYDFCGAKDFTTVYSNGGSDEYKKDHVDQFKEIFEDIYDGPGLAGLMWLGTLGNHDWGGWRMDMGWDQAIGYTWSQASSAKGRWLTPALYYYVTVKYQDFSVDYYFMDTNVWDALPYGERPPHNICGPHNPATASCAAAGGPPGRAEDCKKWFEDLWDEQVEWLGKITAKSTADWRIVVTHFPPYWGRKHWVEVAPKNEIDVIITGHRHSQNMHGPTDKPARIWPEDKSNHEMSDFLDPTAWIVSGGGGGITSEHVPDNDGKDDQYGFVDMTLSKEKLTFEMISHGGFVRRKMELTHHYKHNVPGAKEKPEKKEKVESEKEAKNKTESPPSPEKNEGKEKGEKDMEEHKDEKAA